MIHIPSNRLRSKIRWTGHCIASIKAMIPKHFRNFAFIQYTELIVRSLLINKQSKMGPFLNVMCRKDPHAMLSWFENK